MSFWLDDWLHGIGANSHCCIITVRREWTAELLYYIDVANCNYIYYYWTTCSVIVHVHQSRPSLKSHLQMAQLSPGTSRRESLAGRPSAISTMCCLQSAMTCTTSPTSGCWVPPTQVAQEEWGKEGGPGDAAAAICPCAITGCLWYSSDSSRHGSSSTSYLIYFH